MGNGRLKVKERTGVGFNPLFFFVYNRLIPRILTNKSLSNELCIDFPRSVLVGSYAFDDSFLA